MKKKQQKKQKNSLVETMLKQYLLFKVPWGRLITSSKVRSSHPDLFYEKDVYVYEKVSGKQPCRSLFLKKCQAGDLQPYWKRDFDANFFPVNFLSK